MEIITAGDGTAHVSSADDGTIYAGIAGNECYVTGVGDRLSCTMQGANTALVGTGVGIMYGRAFRVAMPEEVTIQSGTQSQRRHDVICAHFTTSSEGHESGELVVLKGTPTSGQEAEDPEIPSGDILEGATEAYMPLWRIPLDGINVGEPEAMFDVLMSMSELQGEIAEVRDSVSQAIDDWISCIRVGKIGIIIADNIASDKAGGYTTYTMPDGMVPDDSLLSDSSNIGFSAPLSYRGKPSEGQSGFMSLTKKSGAWYLDIWTSTTGKYYLGELVFPIR